MWSFQLAECTVYIHIAIYVVRIYPCLHGYNSHLSLGRSYTRVLVLGVASGIRTVIVQQWVQTVTA